MQDLIIGTRGSDLALWQAHHVQDLLKAGGIHSTLKIIKTQGDRIQHLSFDKMEGKGFFTKEIEAALLSDEVDLAVHSHKDLETSDPPGLAVIAVPERGPVEDMLLVHKDAANPQSPFKVKAHAVIGTSSARRKTQLLHHIPDCEVKDLRGNVPTRVGKLADGQYDAIVIARAGLVRLEMDLSAFEVVELNPTAFIPAPAQGALALQMRASDHRINEVRKLTHEATRKRVAVEREVLRKLEGGCQLPLGTYCTIHEDGTYTLRAAFAENASTPATFLTLEDRDPELLIERMLNTIKKKA